MGTEITGCSDAYTSQQQCLSVYKRLLGIVETSAAARPSILG
jgi:hypothetical protein